MLDFGKFVRNIQKMQDRPVYFLASTAFLRERKDKELENQDRQKIQEAFGVSWSYDFDAADVSPCHRKSTYFTNIPYELTEIEKRYDLCSSDCLEDEFAPAAQIVENHVVVKSPCLMSSKSGLDTVRMRVYKRESVDGTPSATKFVARSLRTSEREKLMGLPPNYVTAPGTTLIEYI